VDPFVARAASAHGAGTGPFMARATAARDAWTGEMATTLPAAGTESGDTGRAWTASGAAIDVPFSG
jgi:hypothetical protein